MLSERALSARDFATNLSVIRADRALKLIEGGEAVETPVAAIHPGDLVLVRAGERIAVDGAVEDGRSDVDQSLVTGETAPVAVSTGSAVYAGALNLTGALSVRVTKEAGQALLDEVKTLLAKAIEQRSSYVRLADRAARGSISPASGSQSNGMMERSSLRRFSSDSRPWAIPPIRSRWARSTASKGRQRGSSCVASASPSSLR